MGTAHKTPKKQHSFDAADVLFALLSYDGVIIRQIAAKAHVDLAQAGRINKLSGGKCRSSDHRAAYDHMTPFVAAGLQRVCRNNRS